MNDDSIALFDMDGSLADYDAAMRRDLRALSATCEPEILDTDNLHALEDERHIEARMRLIKSGVGWWGSLPRIEAGFQVVQVARAAGFDINILTKGPSGHAIAWKEKLEWCKAQPELADADIHMTMDKGLVYGRLLYDDYPVYMSRWLANRPNGLGIMPATSYNADFAHPNVVKWDGSNIDEVAAAVRAAYTRGPREALVLR